MRIVWEHCWPVPQGQAGPRPLAVEASPACPKTSWKSTSALARATSLLAAIVMPRRSCQRFFRFTLVALACQLCAGCRHRLVHLQHSALLLKAGFLTADIVTSAPEQGLQESKHWMSPQLEVAPCSFNGANGVKFLSTVGAPCRSPRPRRLRAAIDWLGERSFPASRALAALPRSICPSTRIGPK